jgi:predicted ATPase
LLRDRRQETHARIARALEEHFPEVAETRPELLAHHLAAAGSAERAVLWWRRAGRLAIERAAMAEAVAHFTAGLQALAGLPGGAERDRGELDLQVELGGALIAAKGWAAPETGRAYVRARELCGQLGETGRLIPVLNGLAVYHISRAEPEAGRAAAEEMLRLAIAQDAAGEGRAHCTLGYALFKLGRLAQARGQLERSLALFDPARHRVLGTDYSDDTRISGLSWLANTLLVLGFPDQALARSREALAEARGLRHVSLALALTVGGCWIRCLAGDPQALSEHAEELVALSTREEIPFYLTLGRLFRGWALAAAEGGGGAEEGIALMQEAVAAFRATGAGTGVPHYLGLLADAHRMAGVPERGLDLLREGLALVDRSGERWCEAELHRLHGELLLGLRARNALTEAETCLHRAVTVARDQVARWWELRAATSLARLRRDQGRVAEARGLLAPVYASFTEGFAFPDFVEAKALLEDLGAAPADGADRRRDKARTPWGPDHLRDPVADR